MNKKYLSLGLGLALSISLVACGGKQVTQEPPSEPQQQNEPVTQLTEVKTEEPKPEEPKLEEPNLVKPDSSVDTVGENDLVNETEPANEVVPVDPFNEVNETVYATGTVNIRASWSLDSEKLGVLSKGDSLTRIGLGVDDADGWSRVILADGSTAYISNKYLSTTKPVVQQQQSQSNGNSSTKTQIQQPQYSEQESTVSNVVNEEDGAAAFAQMIKEQGLVGGKNGRDLTEEELASIASQLQLAP